MHRHVAKSLETIRSPALCTICSIPLDSEHFDESRVTKAPEIGEEISLARFELPPQYCGVLEYISQFTDEHAKDSSKIETPGLRWMILSNNRPLYPYLNLDRIVNPWGYGSFQISIRLDENATIEFVVRRVSNEAPGITRVGGRIVGRYWYNSIYGDVV
ncbi:MAG: hypothetical protein HY694_18615 [Deltaproteobacteria bacterium]|nr:hypothetical protein [Deltaproteobacteria bacterium]